MKLTTFLLFAGFISVSAGTFGQKINLDKKNYSLKNIFKSIEKQTDYQFLFFDNDISNEGNILISAKNEDLHQVLNEVFKNKQLTYTFAGKTIVISKRLTSPPLTASTNTDLPDPITVKGSITDSTGKPLVGASIKIVGSNMNTTTDEKGFFSINVEDDDKLEISFVDYVTQIIAVNNRKFIKIVLKRDVQELEETVVVGYGRQKKATLVGSVQTIKPEELSMPTASLSNAIGGKISGIIAYQRTGAPGADGSNFFIRGIATYSGATNPLIILDGVEISSGDLNALTPEIIENFSVLKDATATAIYGSRGANGVIIITTKTGKNLDKPRMYVRVQSQISTPTSIPKFVDGVKYMELYNEAAIQRSTGQVLYTPTKIDGTRQNLNKYIFPNVNWYNELFKRNTFNQEINFNIQGGGKKVGYFMSVTANNSNGLLKNFKLNSYNNNINVKRYTFQNNLNVDVSKSTKIALKINTQLRYYHGNPAGDQNVFGQLIYTNAVDFPMYFPLDSIRDRRDVKYGGKNIDFVNKNPFAEMVNGYTDDFQSMVVSTLDGEQKLDFLTKGLSFKALASFKNWSKTGVSRRSYYNQYEVTSYTVNPDGSYNYTPALIGNYANTSLGTSTSTTGDRNIYLQASFDYKRSFGSHSLTGLLLYNQSDYNVNAPGSFLSSLPHRRQGYAGRITYTYLNTYLFEGNFGYNGSENFAEGNRFGFFPSFAAGYVISNENYFSKLKTTINLLKLRASWGKVGNDKIGSNRFPYLSDINLGGRSYSTGIDLNYYLSGPTYNQFANPLISWEIAEKKNIGIDLGLFRKLNLVVDLWQEKRTNIFDNLSNTIPAAFGTYGTDVYANVGQVNAKGIDLSIDYKHSFNKDLNISLKSTFTYAKNKIIKKSEPSYRYKNLSSIGHPVFTLWGYQAERLFIDDAEVASSPTQQLGGFVAGGDIKYKDITAFDGLNNITSDDRIAMGQPYVPQIIYGLSTSIHYKKYELSFLLQGVAQTSFFISSIDPFGSNRTRNVLQIIADNHYSQSNPNIYAAYPKLSILDNPNNTASSSYWLRDGSFLKLRTAEIAYNYKKMTRIFLSGYNLLTFSSFKLWDPEQGGGNGLRYPTQRVINLGVQFRFN